MFKKQRTVKAAVSFTGVGLHTGNTCTMTFKPAPPDSGVKFVRTDLEGQPWVMADIDHVVELARGTTLQHGEAKVYTVEHVLAALAGLQIDNMIVELDSNEPPVGDGSAKPYVDCLLESGIENQDVDKSYLGIFDTQNFLGINTRHLSRLNKMLTFRFGICSDINKKRNLL